MRGPRTPVTWAFLAICLLVTLPTMVFPELYDVLGGLKPLRSPWQRLTLAFQHGFPGLPAIVHLGLNTFLLLEVGRAAERLLGPARFALLTVAAMAAYAVAHLCPLVDGHGASGVIWAYAPVAFVALRRGEAGAGGERLGGVLVVMWGFVTVGMTALVYAMGYRGNPLYALLLGNAFHLSGTAVGVAGALLWRHRIGEACRRAAA